MSNTKIKEKVGSNTKEQLKKLEKNPNYFMGEGVGAPLPKIDKIKKKS